ncbi:MAG: putative MFS family arabinose efflux permease [Granulosicoccus sp.]|jgi:predicted MFS family arabinose efflux permease
MTRNFLLIVTSSIVLGAPMPMLILLGVLAGQSLAPSQALATLPASIQIFSGIIVAIPISVYMGRAGRRKGFLLGACIMIAGGLCAAFALSVSSFILLCLAHLILGSALIALNFFRFAAAESVPDHWKANAISFLLASGLVAALVGPLIYTHFKDALLPIPFAGAYIALAGLGLLGCIPLSLMGKMMPKSVASTTGNNAKTQATKRDILTRPIVLLAVATAAIAQASMVILMIPTPLAMEAFGHEGHHSADVIRWHVVAMFAPGFFTGSLITRFGSMKIISTGFVLLLAAGLVALQGTELVNFYVSLMLLGIGWNFGFIGGTYLLQSSLAENERPLIQGINDTLLAIASSLASLSSGVLYAGFGWQTLASTTLVALTLAIVFLFVSRRKTTA